MNHRMNRLALRGLVVLGVVLLLSACGPSTPVVAPTSVPSTSSPTPIPPTTEPTVAPGVAAADVEQLVNDKFNTVDRNLALWNIQPGLGTVMMEYGNRLARMWYAANADNWDMARYQLDEMIEIQEVGETTRPARAEMLKGFEDSSLAALEEAINAQDKAAFTTAFDNAIVGCNACHSASTGSEWNSYQFIAVQVPTTDPAFYIDWAGAGQGNHIANPPTAPTSAPQPAPTGTLDAAGAAELLTGKFNTVDRSLALWNIQPGLGTVMMEYSNRFSRLYFAAKAENWDMARYQLDEMTEIQEVAETTRPGRAEMLKGFEDNYLSALEQAINEQDAAAFDTAYTNAITGCNACHSASTGSEWSSYQFIKIQTPTADNNDYLLWSNDMSTGNYITNPSPAPTSAPQPAPTGTLDITGIEELVNSLFNNVDRSLALWNIQPGLGTVMIEYSNRLARIWYAAKVGNWDMARYQLDEMIEIQEVAETTRPGRAEMLKSFEDNYLTALEQAIVAQDAAAFDTAYANTIIGCNGCHSASTGSEWSSYGYIQFQQPPTDPASFLQWATSGGTGNYKP